MDSSDARAFKEIYELLRIFPEVLVSKIPQNKMDFFYEHMDKEYPFEVTIETFDPSSLSEETIAILTTLYRDCWASEEERQKIIHFEVAEYKKIQNTRNLGVNYSEILRKQSEDRIKEENREINEDSQSQELIETKESFWKKILAKIFGFLGKKD